MKAGVPFTRFSVVSFLLFGFFFFPLKVFSDPSTVVTAQFKLNSTSGDRIIEESASYSQSLTKEWRIGGELTFGKLKSADILFHGDVVYGRLSVSRHWPGGWKLAFGPGFGRSEGRRTFSPFFYVEYHPSDRLHLSLEYDHRTLRADFPQAVAAGTLLDTAYFEWKYRPFEGLILNGSYEFGRNYLPRGAQGFEQTVDTSFAVVILKKPDFTLGYEHYFADVSETGGFLNDVGLARRLNIHYITGTLGYRFHRRLAWDGAFYFGEDTARNLHLFQGDLFELKTRFVMTAASWLDITLSYDFQKQTVRNVTGKSREGILEISGHW